METGDLKGSANDLAEVRVVLRVISHIVMVGGETPSRTSSASLHSIKALPRPTLLRHCCRLQGFSAKERRRNRNNNKIIRAAINSGSKLARPSADDLVR